MNRSEQINELAAALAKAQAATGIAKKDSINPHYKSKYADLANVWEAVREPLTANGLSIVQFPRTVEHGVEIETILLHVSGQFLSDILWVPVLKMDAQALGSSITYGRRFALMSVAGVAPAATPDEIKDVGDDDGNAASHKSGVPGSAGGGTDFRPAGPRRPLPSSANGRRMAADEPHLIDETREKGTTGAPAPAADRAEKIATKSREWVDRAVNTLKLSGQTTDSIKRFLADNATEIQFLEAQAPAQHERFFEVVNSCLEAADARVPF